MNRRSPLLFGFLLAAISLALLLSLFSWKTFSVQADETTVAWLAKQTAEGRVPYRDFFCFIPPLTTYGLAALLKAGGSPLATFRILCVLVLLASTLLAYGLLLKRDWPAPWAAALALQIPALLVPFWPVASHHWLALGAGLCALALFERAQRLPSPDRHFLAGFVAGLSALTLQSDGLFFSVLLFALALSAPAPFSRERLGALGALALGEALAAGLAALFLLFQGTLGDALYNLVVWPSRYYKQAGGFNDVKFPVELASEVASRVAGKPPLEAVAGLLPLAGLLLLAGWAFSSVVFSRPWTSAGERFPRRWAASFAALLAALFLFLAGRPDWMHFAFSVPFFVASALSARRPGKAAAPSRPLKGLLLFLLLLALLRWPSALRSRPPLLADLLSVDGKVQAHSTPRILTERPDIAAAGKAVVCLPQGATLYLYWAPVPPPLDWVQPPSQRANAPWEFALLSAFLEEHGIPLVLIRREYVPGFLDEPSPLARVLREQYRHAGSYDVGELYERTTP
ncbi:MAG: hypothetical protein ACP5VN_04165 [Acidobacteriota bacterium]